jgi:predicted HicB family RNase H-like nuclease
MQTASFVEALRREVAAAVASGDAGTSAAVERLAASLEAAAHLWLLDAATQAADQVSAQLAEGHVEVRLAGRDPELVYVASPEPEPQAAGDEAYDARITLRLPEALKTQVERWAAADGVSVNTWLVRTIARGATPPRRTPGRRLTGYGQS